MPTLCGYVYLKVGTLSEIERQQHGRTWLLPYELHVTEEISLPGHGAVHEYV